MIINSINAESIALFCTLTLRTLWSYKETTTIKGKKKVTQKQGQKAE